MQRRLAAIVCADVAGYSRLMGADEAGTHAAFKAHRSAIYPLILNHGGRMVKNTGDGFLLEFPSVVGSIEAAIEMQNLMAERNAQLPAERVMRFRMGVHMGDVIADEDEVFGDDVNIAVRLESVAAPGGVAVSAKAYLEAGRHISTVLINAGSHHLKNIGELLNVWTWEPGGTEASPAEWAAAAKLPAQYRTAIVGVLPFINRADADDEYFADGLTEDLIHALSLQSFYRVLSRNSTFPFKGQNLSARLIAREIDATYLIQGSVRRAGNKLRVTAELIAPETGAQLWAGRYDRDMGELFALQDELTTSLSAALAPEIFRAEASAPSRSCSTDLTAWDRFLRGMSRYYKQTKPDFEASIAFFREAIALDPSLGIARAYLATIMVQGVQYGWIRSTRELWTEAMELAESAVRLDPRSAFAYQILSYIHGMSGHYDAARETATRGRRTEPLRHGRPRHPRHEPPRRRRAPPGHRAVFDRRAARQHRPAISMGRPARLQPLSARTIRRRAVLAARSALPQSDSPAGAGAEDRHAGTARPWRRSSSGSQGPAGELSGHHRREAPAKLLLEGARRRRTLS